MYETAEVVTWKGQPVTTMTREELLVVVSGLMTLLREERSQHAADIEISGVFIDTLHRAYRRPTKTA